MTEEPERWPSDLTAKEIVEVRRLLMLTRELIPTPARWTRMVYARDGRGKEVSPDDGTAVRFCVSARSSRQSTSYTTPV